MAIKIFYRAYMYNASDHNNNIIKIPKDILLFFYSG